MTNKNKKLLLVDYRQDNIQNIQQIKHDNVDIMIVIDFDNIEINDNYDEIGVLGNLDSKFEIIDNKNYNKYLNIDFNYESNNFIFNYSNSYLLLIKNFTIYGGIFYLSDYTLNCVINNETGTINVATNNVGKYIFNVNYNIFSIIITKTITLTILPIIDYNESYTIYDNITYISDVPNIYPNNFGTESNNFSIESNNLPININNNGSFIVQSLKKGNYEFIVNYNVNNILVKKPIKLIVESIINYNNYFYEVNYLENLIIDSPSINNQLYIGGIFSLDNENFIIDKNIGKIFTNKTLETKIYDINVIYSVNNYTFETKIKISVIPIIKYNFENLIEGQTINTHKPEIISSSTINFSIDKNNVSINKKTGVITLYDYEAGIYELSIVIKYNGYVYYLNEKITILPYINFHQNKLTFDYFKNKGQLYIKDTKDIESLGIGKHKLIAQYTKNEQIIIKEVELDIVPNFDYKINKYLVTDNIEIHTENPYSGKFIYTKNDVVIDELTGTITISNPEVKKYQINFVYLYNDISYNETLSFSVYPSVTYQNNQIIYYHNDLNLCKPQVNPIGGDFTIDNKNFKINNNGSIIANENIELGTYDILVSYTFNNLTTEIPLTVAVIPNIKYDKEFFFDKNYINIIKPTNLLYDNVIFKIKNNFNNFFSINEQGHILISQNINIGLYQIEIDAIVKNVKTTNVINIYVCPNIVYNETNYNINYGTEFIINKPNIIDIGGEFTINNKNITINKSTGEITIHNNILPNAYSFIVTYTLENSIKNITFNVNIYPNLKYNLINIEYNKKTKSSEPEFSPQGGIFNCMYNKNVIIDNNNGVLCFNNDINVGSYNILVKYIYNNIYTEFDCYYNVLPTINYSDNYNFNNNNFKIKPITINPTGGTFNLNNDNFIINNSGEIKVKNNIIGTTYLNIEYENILKINKTIKINISPDFYYNDITVNYKDFIKIIPTNLINKGTFKLLNYNDIFDIIDNGIITCKLKSEIIDVGKYNINIEYNLDEIVLKKSVNLNVIPIIKSDNLNIVTDNLNIVAEPFNGKFNLKDNKHVIIDENSGNIKFNNNVIPGIYNTEIEYLYNNMKVTKNITINKKLTLEYDNNITIIKGFDYEFKPTVNFSNGKYKLNKNNKNNFVKIDENTGIITIDKNIPLGNYNFEIEYSAYENIVIFMLEFVVLSPFSYKEPIYKFNYNENARIEPNNNFEGSEFYISKVDGLTIDKDTGIIYVNKLDVGIYILEVNCFSNGHVLNTTVKVIISPIIKYNESLINIKHGNTYISKIPQMFPDNGIFYTESTIINLNEDGSFTVNDNIDANIYYFDIIYEVNEIKTTSTIKLVVNPIFEYKTSEICIDYGNEYFSEMPKYHPKDGLFTIVNQPKYITIEKNGIIHINKNLAIGSYDLSILYKINKINLTNTINIKILPIFNYSTIDLTLYNKFFVGYYKNKNINFECFNDIYQCHKIVTSNKPNIANKGYFTIHNPLSAVNINGDDGIITLKNNNIGVYSFDVNYSVFNISKIYNYQVLITPLFKYESTNFVTKNNTEYIIKAPEVYPEGGIFYFPETYDFFNINFNNGEIICKKAEINIYTITVLYELNGFISYNELTITVYPDTYIENIETTIMGYNLLKINNNYNKLLIKDYEIIDNQIQVKTDKIGLHEFNLIGVYKNIEFLINFSVKVLPIVNYDQSIYYVDFGKTLNIKKPVINYLDENGYFIITNKIKGITIDRLSGEIYVFDKLYVNNYLININYVLNDVITQITINVIVKPTLEYNLTKYEFIYNDIYSVEIPKVSPTNGIFKTDHDNITIDNNGVFSFLESNVGIYNFVVSYTINSIVSVCNISVKIKPMIKYDEKYVIEFGKPTLIKPLVLSPPDHVVKAVKLPNNIKIDESNGYINILDNCEPDNYIIKLIYNVNDVETFTFLNITIDPFINKNQTIKTTHGLTDMLELHKSPLNILYNITNKSNKFYFNANQLYFNNLDVETYNLKINYKINKLSDEINVNINVVPTIIYNEIYEFKYDDIVSISPIKQSPNNGYFKLINDYFIIDRNGCITQKQNSSLNITTYDLNVEYSVNKVKTMFNLKIKIKPLLEYEKTYYGLQNETLLIDPINYLPKKLNFSVEPFGEINSIGKIQLDNLQIGNYQLKVNYDCTSVLLNVIVKPVFFYIDNNITLEFGTNKIFIPSVSQNNGKFYFSTEVNNFTIDENTGIIKTTNLLPDNYSIMVNYLYNAVVVSTELKVNVVPLFKYNNNNLVIKYKSEITTIIPTFNPLGGTFYIESKLLSNNIYLDETNGNITIDEANLGDYEFNVNYSYNKQIVSQKIKFSIIPVVLYDKCDLTFYNGIENKIEAPYVNPFFGKFRLNCDTFLSKYLSINNNGEITINNELSVGLYDFSVIYEHNKIEFSTKISINILPFLYYDTVITEYQNNSLVIEPQFSVFNHGLYDFVIPNYDLKINSDGKITNFNCLNVGTYKIIVEYKHLNKNYQTYFITQISPIIIPNFINNTVYLYPENGKLEYDNKYFNINNNKIKYKNIYDNTIVPMTYTLNNVTKKLLIQYTSKPIKIFDNEITVIYNTNKKINSYVNSGIISSDNKPKNLIIEDLSLNIENLDVGTYNFNINYLINNLTFNQDIKLIIMPKICYLNKYYEINGNIGTTTDQPILEPNNGKISIKQFIKNINVTNTGLISSFNTIPNIYDITVQYTVNNLTAIENLTICCKPTLYLENDSYIIKYGDQFTIKNFKCYPQIGQFTSSIPIISSNKSEITFDYLHDLNIGNHKINLDYTCNNIKSSIVISLVIEPTITYLNKNYKITYGNKQNIPAPAVSHNYGTFNIDIKSENKIEKNDIIILNNGSINIENLEIGDYTLYISYFIDTFIITDIINLTVDPYLYYNENVFTMIYNKEHLKFNINAPKFYPLGGTFYIDQQNQNITINKDNGIIELDNLNIGKYNFNVFYKFKKTSLKTNITINMNPYVNYNLPVINIKYKTLYTINNPDTSNIGGLFLSKNLPKGVTINSKNGIITINQREYLEIGFYNLIINYNINGLTTSTNIYINVTK